MPLANLANRPISAPSDERSGEINDVITSADGRIKAVVLGIGGFLGFGERDLTVEMSSLRFVAETAVQTTTEIVAEREVLVRPQVGTEGYRDLAIADLTVDELTGERVYLQATRAQLEAEPECVAEWAII